MIRAYNKVYLNDVMITLGEFFGYAKNIEELNNLANNFLSSEIYKEFDKGNPRYLNLPSHILYEEVMGITLESNDSNSFDKTPFYWTGYALAYFHWCSGLSFKNIFELLTINKIFNMYHPFHECSLDKFVDVCNQIIFSKETNLAKIRKQLNLSQRELSDLSGVSLRSIQLYEQRQLDINSAPVSKLLAISKILHCGIEDLIETNQ